MEDQKRRKNKIMTSCDLSEKRRKKIPPSKYKIPSLNDFSANIVTNEYFISQLIKDGFIQQKDYEQFLDGRQGEEAENLRLFLRGQLNDFKMKYESFFYNFLKKDPQLMIKQMHFFQKNLRNYYILSIYLNRDYGLPHLENRISFANKSNLLIQQSQFAHFLRSIKCNICTKKIPFCCFFQHSKACYQLHESKKMLLQTNQIILDICQYLQKESQQLEQAVMFSKSNFQENKSVQERIKKFVDSVKKSESGETQQMLDNIRRSIQSSMDQKQTMVTMPGSLQQIKASKSTFSNYNHVNQCSQFNTANDNNNNRPIYDKFSTFVNSDYRQAELSKSKSKKNTRRKYIERTCPNFPSKNHSLSLEKKRSYNTNIKPNIHLQDDNMNFFYESISKQRDSQRQSEDKKNCNNEDSPTHIKDVQLDFNENHEPVKKNQSNEKTESNEKYESDEKSKFMSPLQKKASDSATEDCLLNTPYSPQFKLENDHNIIQKISIGHEKPYTAEKDIKLKKGTLELPYTLSPQIRERKRSNLNDRIHRISFGISSKNIIKNYKEKIFMHDNMTSNERKANISRMRFSFENKGSDQRKRSHQKHLPFNLLDQESVVSEQYGSSYKDKSKKCIPQSLRNISDVMIIGQQRAKTEQDLSQLQNNGMGVRTSCSLKNTQIDLSCNPMSQITFCAKTKSSQSINRQSIENSLFPRHFFNRTSQEENYMNQISSDILNNSDTQYNKQTSEKAIQQNDSQPIKSYVKIQNMFKEQPWYDNTSYLQEKQFINNHQEEVEEKKNQEDVDKLPFRQKKYSNFYFQSNPQNEDMEDKGIITINDQVFQTLSIQKSNHTNSAKKSGGCKKGSTKKSSIFDNSMESPQRETPNERLIKKVKSTSNKNLEQHDDVTLEAKGVQMPFMSPQYGPSNITLLQQKIPDYMNYAKLKYQKQNNAESQQEGRNISHGLMNAQIQILKNYSRTEYHKNNYSELDIQNFQIVLKNYKKNLLQNPFINNLFSDNEMLVKVSDLTTRMSQCEIKTLMEQLKESLAKRIELLKNIRRNEGLINDMELEGEQKTKIKSKLSKSFGNLSILEEHNSVQKRHSIFFQQPQDSVIGKSQLGDFDAQDDVIDMESEFFKDLEDNMDQSNDINQNDSINEEQARSNCSPNVKIIPTSGIQEIKLFKSSQTSNQNNMQEKGPTSSKINPYCLGYQNAKLHENKTSVSNLNESVQRSPYNILHGRKLSDTDFIIDLQQQRDYAEKVQPISLENFIINGEIGKGAYGKVFEVQRKGTKETFAMKAIKFAQNVSKSVLQQLQNEISILNVIKGRYLVQAYYSFVQNQTLFIVMEYLKGGDFRQLLKEEIRLDPHVARYYMAQLVLAIESLHQKNVIHRDLKPENLLLDQKGKLKLADFGLSEFKNKLHSQNCNDNINVSQIEFMATTEKVERRIVGTPDYIPPEGIFGYQESYSDLEHNTPAPYIESDISSIDHNTSSRFKHLLTTESKDKNKNLLNSNNGEEEDIDINVSDNMVSSLSNDQRRLSHRQNNGILAMAIDWWAAGCLLYEFTIGASCFGAMTVTEVYQNIKERKIMWPDIGYEEDMISPETKDLIEKLLDPNPHTRLNTNRLQDIKGHPFFNGLDWDTIDNQDPPFDFQPPIKTTTLKQFNSVLHKQNEEALMNFDQNDLSIIRLDLLYEKNIQLFQQYKYTNKKLARFPQWQN